MQATVTEITVVMSAMPIELRSASVNSLVWKMPSSSRSTTCSGRSCRRRSSTGPNDSERSTAGDQRGEDHHDVVTPQVAFSRPVGRTSLCWAREVPKPLTKMDAIDHDHHEDEDRHRRAETEVQRLAAGCSRGSRPSRCCSGPAEDEDRVEDPKRVEKCGKQRDQDGQLDQRHRDPKKRCTRRCVDLGRLVQLVGHEREPASGSRSAMNGVVFQTSVRMIAT